MTTILTLLKMFGAYSSERKVTADGHKLQLFVKNATADEEPLSDRWRPKSDKSSRKMRKNVLVSSTSSLVKGPPYLFLPRSMREGISFSQ